MKSLLGYFVDKNVKVGDAKRRKETKPILVKGRDDRYNGKLVVLIDSRSASCSELFAPVVQLERAGAVVGDRSEGAVMISRLHNFQMGADVVVFYGASITDADLVMSDGKSLEHRICITPSWRKLCSLRPQCLKSSGNEPFQALLRRRDSRAWIHHCDAAIANLLV